MESIQGYSQNIPLTPQHLPIEQEIEAVLEVDTWD